MLYQANVVVIQSMDQACVVSSQCCDPVNGSSLCCIKLVCAQDSESESCLETQRRKGDVSGSLARIGCVQAIL